MNICIFEDFSVSDLAPANYLRHTSELICGAFTLGNKTLNSLHGRYKLTIHSRKYISDYCAEKFQGAAVNRLSKGEYIFLNSRVLFDEDNIKDILKSFKKKNNSAFIQDNAIVAFHLDTGKTAQFTEVINNEEENLISPADIEWLNLEKISVQNFRVINYPSDLILYNEEELHKDLKLLAGGKKLQISRKAKFGKQVVFDTSKGGIYVGKNTVIEPFTFIQGPVYIGDNCTIRSGTQIYGPVSIGNFCKTSGEITCSVLHSYVNKQHYGFLGHSYLCEWINLGAGTTTSNLKNNYSKIYLNLNGKSIDTGSIFLGSIIGDHTKTGINTMLNTGTMAGISTNLYGAGYQNKILKSFSWNNASSSNAINYNIAKAVNTARISMARRNIEMNKTYEDLLNYLYNQKQDLPV